MWYRGVKGPWDHEKVAPDRLVWWTEDYLDARDYASSIERARIAATNLPGSDDCRYADLDDPEVRNHLEGAGYDPDDLFALTEDPDLIPFLTAAGYEGVKVYHEAAGATHCAVFDSLRLGGVSSLPVIDPDQAVVVEPGTKLFHGTGERFDVRTLKGGGYDGIVWTSDHPLVARAYIPVQGGYSLTSPRLIATDRNEDPTSAAIKSAIGEWPALERAAWKKASENLRRYTELRREEESHEEQYLQHKTAARTGVGKTLSKETLDALFDRWSKAEEERQALPHLNAEALLTKMVEQRLRARGYDVSEDRVKLSFDYKTGEMLPPDYRLKGTLITLTPQRPLRLYDHARNQGDEGDLMEVQYHDHKVFAAAKAAGFDGVVIHDFAQTEVHGNLGHRSWGLFPHVLESMEVRSKAGEVHPTKDEWERDRKARHEEYEKAKAERYAKTDPEELRDFLIQRWEAHKARYRYPGEGFDGSYELVGKMVEERLPTQAKTLMEAWGIPTKEEEERPILAKDMMSYHRESWQREFDALQSNHTSANKHERRAEHVQQGR